MGPEDLEVSFSMAKDPICGMQVDERTAKWKAEYQGQTYYFCAQSCQRTFLQNPAKYAAR